VPDHGGGIIFHPPAHSNHNNWPGESLLLLKIRM
jgi:hypothetical protein